MGAGAATMTAAALLLGPSAAVAEPTNPADQSQAVQEAVDQARQAAEDAARAAQDAAQSAQEAADQAEQAVRDATDGGPGGADRIDVTEGQVDWLPQNLQDDLQNLQDLPADQRAEKIQQILQNAATGHYGDAVENWAERMVDFADALPQDLRNDLQGVMGMQPGAAQQRLQEIWQGALNGDYGREVQRWGQWAQQTFQQWDLGEVIQGDTNAGGGTVD